MGPLCQGATHTTVSPPALCQSRFARPAKFPAAAAERQLHHPINDNDIAPSFDVEVGLTSAHA
jgi:hypothetical protein